MPNTSPDPPPNTGTPAGKPTRVPHLSRGITRVSPTASTLLDHKPLTCTCAPDLDHLDRTRRDLQPVPGGPERGAQYEYGGVVGAVDPVLQGLLTHPAKLPALRSGPDARVRKGRHEDRRGVAAGHTRSGKRAGQILMTRWHIAQPAPDRTDGRSRDDAWSPSPCRHTRPARYRQRTIPAGSRHSSPAYRAGSPSGVRNSRWYHRRGSPPGPWRTSRSSPMSKS